MNNQRFHWAKLLVRRILDQTTLSDIKKALASIPDGIDGIIQLAMDMINRQSQPRALLATRTLALITSARVPMIAEALSHALGIYHALQHDDDPQQLAQDDIPHPLTIIQCCEGLGDKRSNNKNHCHGALRCSTVYANTMGQVVLNEGEIYVCRHHSGLSLTRHFLFRIL